MPRAFLRSVFAGLLALGVSLGAGVQAQTPPAHGARVPPPPSAMPDTPKPAGATPSPPGTPAATTQAGESRARPVTPAASMPAEGKKRASRAKTPPGKPPRGAALCNQSDKAQRQRCLNDIYGAGGPRI
jgi:hypothetical protein